MVRPAGPWVVYYLDDEHEYLMSPVILGADGARCTLLGASIVLWDWEAGQGSSPAGDYVVFHTWDGLIDHRLVIVDLTLGQMVREIPLLSEATRERVLEDYFGSEPLIWIGDLPVSLRAWSPDGRYLAFSGALDGPSLDLYVYDLEEDTIRRLTSEPQLEALMAWSPDSRWIVYMDASSWTLEGFAIDGVRAVMVDGSVDREMFPSDAWDESIVGWISEHAFVVQSLSFEAPAYDLRQVDVETGSVRLRYRGTFDEAALDPGTGFLVVNVSGTMFWTPSVPTGLYILKGRISVPQLLLPGTYVGLRSYPQLGSFVAETWNEQPGHVMFTPDGEVQLELEGERRFFPSPDGRWLAVGGTNSLELYDVTTTLMEPLVLSPGCHGIRWLPDSSAFVCSVQAGTRSSPCQLYLHEEATDWAARGIAEDVSCTVPLVVDR